MSPGRRFLIQRCYTRVCRDCRFKLEPDRAAHLAAMMAEVSPIEIWLALGLDNMERIANGTHPCLVMEQYA